MVNQTQTPPPEWQELAVKDLTRVSQPRIRVSSSGQCERALVYAAQELPETDPPDERARNMMALGHMAEILIILNLHTLGWETKHTVVEGGQLWLEVTVPGTTRVLRGRPDGVCRHPEFTKNHWVTLECKSMSPDMADQVEESGITAVYPKYINQIAIYGDRLHARQYVSHPHSGVFAMMDRNGRPLPPERVKWDPEKAEQTLLSLKLAWERAERNEYPERPYPPDSFECRYCNYHSLCRGPRTIIPEPDGPHTTAVHSDDPQVLEAALDWLSMDSDVRRTKRVLQDASDNLGKINIIAGEVTAGYFQPRNPPVYDPALLHRKVPADILRECRSPYQDRREGFWVRKTR